MCNPRTWFVAAICRAFEIAGLLCELPHEIRQKIESLFGRKKYIILQIKPSNEILPNLNIALQTHIKKPTTVTHQTVIDVHFQTPPDCQTH